MYLLFDIGGTKTRLAISRNGEEMDPPNIFATPQNPVEFLNIIKKELPSIIENNKLQKIIGGIAGVTEEKRGILLSSGLKQWIGFELQKEMQNIFQAPVIIKNDAALAGLGEAMYGAGRGKDIVMYLTISTGVGGARIVHGKIDESAQGFEPGHQLILLKNDEVVELEDLVSGSGVRKRYNQNPENITDENVWEDVTRYLAIGIHNSMVHWSPERIVLGGSVMMNRINIEFLRFYLKKYSHIFPVLPEIVKAELGDLNGLYGAFALTKEVL